jgi:putative oxidoreductase
MQINFANIAIYIAILQIYSFPMLILFTHRRIIMNEQQRNQIGVFILRVSLGGVLIAHSIYLKLMVFTLPGTAQFFSSIGLPAILAYVVFTIEAVAGIALVLGVKTRLFASITVPVLIGATWAHLGNGWVFSNANGGWEYPAFLGLAALAQAFLGGGALTLKLPLFHTPKTVAA